MDNCVSCGSPVPEGQRNCSMCYGDPDHGSDGYYREYLEEWEREHAEREAERAEYEAYMEALYQTEDQARQEQAEWEEAMAASQEAENEE